MKKLLLSAVMVFTMLFSCGDDEGDTLGKIKGTVYYDGNDDGALKIAAHTSVPPKGAPMGYTTVDEPVFPQAYEITDLPGGTYYMFATIDVGGNNPIQYGDEDPISGFSDAVVVAAEDTVEGIDLTVQDPG